MKHFIIILLLASATIGFSQGSRTVGFYTFEDPISNLKPFWSEITNQDSIIIKESTITDNNNWARTKLHYYDTLGHLYKSEEWIEKQKKRKAHLYKVNNFNIEYDTEQGFQVLMYRDNHREIDYDSIKYTSDGTVEYRRLIHYRKLDLVKWDTIPKLYCKLILQKDSLKKYEVINGIGEKSINTYINNRPVSFKWKNYTDSLVYNDYQNYTIVKFYFKNLGDSVFHLGKVDSIVNNQILSTKVYERYNEKNVKIEKSYYDEKRRLVLKTSTHSRYPFEAHYYTGSRHIRYRMENGKMYNYNFYSFKQFPYLNWKLTSAFD